MPLVKKHGCREHNRMFQLMEQNCGYKASHIPHLQDINDFLQDSTGFQMRPVAGLLSSRNFLYGLAFRVFFSTQYIRHHSKPLYTPEPDVCHELLGHAPLFADKTFADFSQEIGLASLGATDDQIIRLARCYWFSVEFGLCLEDGERKAYGAGLLSSFGELEYSMSDEPEVRPWDPENAGMQDFPITTYQPIYYAANSFEDARLQMSAYASSFSRPFNVRFDPYTSRVNIDANIEMDEPTAADASKPDGY
jgi:phenylalanine-4-hydroxylase